MNSWMFALVLASVFLGVAIADLLNLCGCPG